MPFCQLVCGPPGSGKSTYCRGLQQFFALCGRPCAVVNLDPGNEDAPYEAQIDVGDLVSLPVVMEELGLGPNGGLLYCMETLEKNLEWLKVRNAPQRCAAPACRAAVPPFPAQKSHAPAVGIPPRLRFRGALRACPRADGRRAVLTRRLERTAGIPPDGAAARARASFRPGTFGAAGREYVRSIRLSRSGRALQLSRVRAAHRSHGRERLGIPCGRSAPRRFPRVRRPAQVSVGRGAQPHCHATPGAAARECAHEDGSLH